MKTKQFLGYCTTFTLGAAISAGFLVLGFQAMEKEQPWYDDLRAKRCSKELWNEQIPEQLIEYCKGIK